MSLTIEDLEGMIAERARAVECGIADAPCAWAAQVLERFEEDQIEQGADAHTIATIRTVRHALEDRPRGCIGRRDVCTPP